MTDELKPATELAANALTPFPEVLAGRAGRSNARYGLTAMAFLTVFTPFTSFAIFSATVL